MFCIILHYCVRGKSAYIANFFISYGSARCYSIYLRFNTPKHFYQKIEKTINYDPLSLQKIYRFNGFDKKKPPRCLVIVGWYFLRVPKIYTYRYVEV